MSSTRGRVNAGLLTLGCVALRALKRDPVTRSIVDLTRDNPADKLEKLGEMIAQLNREE